MAAVRAVFEPIFRFQRFGEYRASGQGGRSTADMHWGVLLRQAEA